MKHAIIEAQQHYQSPADKKHSPAPKIQVGDFVFVLTKFIRTTKPSKKLAEKFLGLFEVVNQLGSHSYLVKLPTHLQSIHPVFHISQLELVHPSTIPNHLNSSLPPIVIDGNLEFELEQVLDSKLDHQRKDPLLYYVQWAGYKGTLEEFSWYQWLTWRMP